MRIFEIACDSAKPTWVQVLPASADLVDAVARHDVAADARLPHADEDDVGIRLGDGDRADRGALDLAVGHRHPVLAAVGRLPEAAAHGAEVGLARPSLHAAHRDRAAAAIRADAAPPKGVEHGTWRPRPAANPPAGPARSPAARCRAATRRLRGRRSSRQRLDEISFMPPGEEALSTGHGPRYDGSMPLFEFQCRDCEKPFESFVTTERKPSCPSCGSENLSKLLSRLGMVGAGASRTSAASCAAPAPMCGAQGGRCGCN